jgi:hypothetical protein
MEDIRDQKDSIITDDTSFEASGAETASWDRVSALLKQGRSSDLCHEVDSS